MNRRLLLIPNSDTILIEGQHYIEASVGNLIEELRLDGYEISVFCQEVHLGYKDIHSYCLEQNNIEYLVTPHRSNAFITYLLLFF